MSGACAVLCLLHYLGNHSPLVPGEGYFLVSHKAPCPPKMLMEGGRQGNVGQVFAAQMMER